MSQYNYYKWPNRASQQDRASVSIMHVQNSALHLNLFTSTFCWVQAACAQGLQSQLVYPTGREILNFLMQEMFKGAGCYYSIGQNWNLSPILYTTLYLHYADIPGNSCFCPVHAHGNSHYVPREARVKRLVNQCKQQPRNILETLLQPGQFDEHDRAENQRGIENTDDGHFNGDVGMELRLLVNLYNHSLLVSTSHL